MGASINSIKPTKLLIGARQNPAKKRSIHAVCEHFEPDFGADSAASANFIEVAL